VREESKFVDLGTAMEMANVTAISLLKIDIEGYEYDVVSSWNSSTPLPEQIAMEIHTGWVIYHKTKSFNDSSDFSNFLCE